MKLAGFALEVPKLLGFRAERPEKWPEIPLGLPSKKPENVWKTAKPKRQIMPPRKKKQPGKLMSKAKTAKKKGGMKKAAARKK